MTLSGVESRSRRSSYQCQPAHRRRLKRSSKWFASISTTRTCSAVLRPSCGRLEDLGVKPLPSLRTINRILSRNDLTHRRTGKYEAEGNTLSQTAVPTAEPDPSDGFGWPMLSDRSDPFLWPQCRSIRQRHVVDCTHRSPSPARTFWTASGPSGQRLGIPDNLQIDNAMSFFGSPTHPAGMEPADSAVPA